MATRDDRIVESDPREQSIGELLKQLSEQTSTLVRQELDLAKAEMTEKGKKAGLGAGIIGAAGILGLLALGSFTAFLIALLSTGMKTWIAALIVTILYAAGAGVAAMAGKNKVQEATPPVPQQTVETLKEDAEWAKTQTRSAGR